MIQPKTMDVPEQVFSDSVMLLKHLKQAELQLSEAYTLVLKLKESNQIIDEELVTHVADSWHYSREALSLLGSNQNEIILPNM